MIRTVITPNTQTIHFNIPKNYVGKKIEVIAFAIDEAQQQQDILPVNTMAQFWGTISNETTKDLHEQIKIGRNEWDKNI
jgi:type 1 glutamine amidotransferase